MKLRTNYAKLKRSRQIITVLAKYGLDYFIDKSKTRLLERIKRVPKNYKFVSLPERIRLSLEELGPTFIKFGQILSTRPDFLPPDLIKELEKLQDQVPPFDSFTAKDIIKRELKKPIDELFKELNPVPIAAASLSQVHKATLLDGETVAVKIQRPDIKEVVALDLEILEDLVEIVDKRLGSGWVYHPKLMIKEFKRAILKEIDFTNEAHHFEKFRINFEDIDYVKVPKIYWDMSTTEILTMEFIDGIKVSKITEDRYKDIFRPKEVAKRGAEIVLKQIFEDRFFHGDPHPANIFILPPSVIVMLDVGMVGYIDENIATNGAKLLRAIIDKDLDSIMRSLEILDMLDGKFDQNLLRQDFMELIERYVGISLKELNFGKLMQDVVKVIVQHNLVLPTNVALMIKSLSMVETTGRQLDPDFNAVLIAEPFINKLLIKEFYPDKLFKKSSKFIQDSVSLVEQLPQGLADTLKKLEKGRLKFVFEHRGLENLTRIIDRSTSRMSLSIIIAGIIVGSSLIVRAGVGPSIFGYPVLGIAGYIVASIMGFILIISIMKSGKWR
jgi:ubiquinone biosynthesis protein